MSCDDDGSPAAGWPWNGAAIAAEYGLGALVGIEPLAGGRAAVARLTTSTGAFVVKPGGQEWEAVLQERAAAALTRAGLRQARLVRTRQGTFVGLGGCTVQEFMPGATSLRAAPGQVSALMRYLPAYLDALAQVPAPPRLRASDTIWTRVASAEHLVAELPGLVRRAGAPKDSCALVAAAIALLEPSLPAMAALPRQLVHGDIGPDNVLMEGDQVVAIVDFTPLEEPAMFAVATAAYWYQVHGHEVLDTRGIRASLMAAEPVRGWTATDRQVWPAMLMREALRRLATPLAIAKEAGARQAGAKEAGRPPQPLPAGPRLRAISSLARAWPDLR
jgi:Ser/Thr protein kinase RdoA (MazF antagonist)